MNYTKMLEDTYVVAKEEHDVSKLEWLSTDVFNFTTYQSNYDELFAQKALEVSAAITERNTFKYIKDETNYMWYLIMCNMPFFVDRIDWGGSIRGGWWTFEQHLDVRGFYVGEKQLTEILHLDETEWKKFITSMKDWAYA